MFGQVLFLKKSLDILCECRRTLMYTYVFAYYLRKNNQSSIFEVFTLTNICAVCTEKNNCGIRSVVFAVKKI